MGCRVEAQPRREYPQQAELEKVAWLEWRRPGRINALPILTLEPDLADFYRDNVIGGPGAFVIVVHSYDEFAAAILHKLITEIAAADRADHTRRGRLASSTVSIAPSQ